MPSLTSDEAIARGRLLDVHSYRIDLDLTGAREAARFPSTTTVRFACTEPGADTFIECKSAVVESARLNGRVLDPADLVDNRFPLTGLAAENELVLRASMEISHTGEGVHRYVDPEDGEVYLYGQAPLDDAQRIFACFDQPDLKARIGLTVRAPDGWLVLANGAGTSRGPGRWEFTETPPQSTYLVTLVAGPYELWQDEHDGIALGLSCRRSLAPHLGRDVDEIFAHTKACFDRYHELFGFRYPFGKYDQAFVPEFNWGAIENPGCVTFAEGYIFRSVVTEAERERRAVVIAHEMAHMWFGDLVTMRWWEDIWLNESFAEYMGWRITAEASRFTQAWTSFAIGRKGSGYAADQRPSTHPVAPEAVGDTELALLNFDGISYAKGASVLRQMAVWLGDEAFLRGLRAYFEAYAFGNATLADFLATLAAASGRDVDAWARVWLRRAQVNTLCPQVRLAEDGTYDAVAVVQTAPFGYPTLRPHRTTLAIFDESPGAGPVTLRQQVELELDPTIDFGHTTVDALVGVRPGLLLLANDADLTFAKIRFDEASRTALPAVLARIADPLARAVVWSAAADATRDAEMAPAEFVALAAAGVPAEAEEAILEDALRFTTQFVLKRYLPPAARPDASAVLAEACERAMMAAEPGSGRQLTAARGFISHAEPERLVAWLDGREVPAGLVVDADLRWTLLHRLVVQGVAGSGEIDAEAVRDPSSKGVEQLARCRASLPDPDAKARAWHTIVDDDVISAHLAGATAQGFWQPEQAELTAGYVTRYFADMPVMAAQRSGNVIQRLATAGYPVFAVSPETVALAEEMLARDDVDPTLRRIVVDSTDELRRSLAARAIHEVRSE